MWLSPTTYAYHETAQQLLLNPFPMLPRNLYFLLWGRLYYGLGPLHPAAIGSINVTFAVILIAL